MKRPRNDDHSDSIKKVTIKRSVRHCEACRQERRVPVNLIGKPKQTKPYNHRRRPTAFDKKLNSLLLTEADVSLIQELPNPLGLRPPGQATATIGE